MFKKQAWFFSYKLQNNVYYINTILHCDTAIHNPLKQWEKKDNKELMMGQYINGALCFDQRVSK